MDEEVTVHRNTHMSTCAVALMLLLAVMGLTLTSCSSSGGSDPAATDDPEVSSTSIDDGQADVGLIEKIDITFSEPMDAATIDDTSIVVAGRTPGIHVSYDTGTQTASVIPESLYAAQIWHTLTISEDVMSAGGVAMEEYSLDFQTGPLDENHIDDYFEPNESTAQAAVVDTGVTYPTLSGWRTDRDIYAFTLTESRRVTVATPIIYAPALPQGPGWQLYFSRADGQHYTTMGTSAHTGSTPANSFSFSPGTYYAEIYNSYGLESGGFILYDLQLMTGPPCQDDAFEDNDFEDEAAAITAGSYSDLRACKVDHDYYVIDMTTGQTLTVTIDATFTEGGWENRRLVMSAPGDSDSTEGTTNPTTLSVTATADGTAWFYVVFWVDGVEYTMDVGLAG